MFRSYTPTLCISLEFTSEPEALPQRPDRQTSDGEAEVGNGVQGLPGVGGWLHEHAGEKDRKRLRFFHLGLCSLKNVWAVMRKIVFFCEATKMCLGLAELGNKILCVFTLYMSNYK